ncbi:hypothetical protein NE237_022249 [Protea cynaroides]|uniref:Uncharacterized protein n=1 Tax=Protea cynaroides TaxID=273540 RepID=A0A9Q0HAK8_9MAGN|nr:hypothetical protein NE237_022249 [Protea cynaroides]
MTGETDERTGDSEVSQVDIGEKSSSNLSSLEDRGKVDGECNGIVHDGVEEMDGYVKDGGDGSYVFVSGLDALSDDLGEKDLDAENVADPAEILKIVPSVEGKTVSEPNVDSQTGEKQAEVGELTVEKVGNDQYPIENGSNIDESVVSSSTNDTAVESSHSQPEGDEVEKNDAANEQNKTALATDVEGNHKSIITTTEIAESKVHLLDRGEVKQNVTVSLTEVEYDEVEKSRLSTTVMVAVECELQQLDYEAKVEEVDRVMEIEEDQIKLHSATEIKENQESENTVKDSAESKGHQLHEAEEPKKLDLAIKEENPESQVIDTQDVELELGQLDNIEDKNPEDNPSGGVRLEAASGPVNTQLEAEALNGSMESGTSLSGGPVASETEVINDLAVVNEAAGSEVPLLDRDGVKQNVTVPLAEVESNEVEGSQVSITVKEAVECELQLLDNEEKVEEVDGVMETEEDQSKLHSATQVKEYQESENTVKDSSEGKGHQLHDGEEEAEEPRKLNLAIKEENQESQVPATQDVETELGQPDNIEEKDPEDNSSQGIRLEAARGPVNTLSEAESLNGSIECGTSLSSGPVASETEVINDLAVVNETAECEVPLLDRDEVKQNVTVSLTEVEYDELEKSRLSITVKVAVECELQQLHYEEKVDEVDRVMEIEEDQIKLHSATEVKENQESENTVKDSAESKRHQLHDGEEEVEEPRKLDLAIKEENPESQAKDTQDVELELGQLDNIEDKDPEDNPSGGIRLESATGPVNTQLEAEALNGSIGNGTSLSSVPVASETEVINDLAVVKEAAESEVPLLDRDGVKQNVTVPLAEVESNEVEESQVSSKVKEAVECELQHLDNEEKVDRVMETEEDQSKLHSATEVKENQESKNMVKDSAESKGHQLHGGEEEAEEPRKLDLSAKEENPESQVTDTQDVESELGQLDNIEEKVPEHNPSRGIRLEAETGPINTQLEAEALNGSIESGTGLFSGPVASETEVTNDLAVGNGNMMCPSDKKPEFENVDGSSKNPARLPHLVDEVVRETEVGNISVEHGESLPTDPVDNMISEAEVRNSCVEISESLPPQGTNLETAVGNGSPDEVESQCTRTAGNGKSENEISNVSVEDAVPKCPAENSVIESKAMNDSVASARSLPSCSVNDVVVESEVLNCSFENGSSLPTCYVADVEQEPEAGNGFGAIGNAPSGDAVNLGAIVQDGLVENGGRGTKTHANDIIDVENGGMQLASGDSDGKPICQKVDTEGIQGNEGLQSSPEGSTVATVDEQKVDAEVVKKPFHFLIKIPRYVDNKFKEQIRLAQLQVEERTQNRDAIRATIQMKRETCNEYRDKFENAKSEERICRDGLSAKRQEIDSVQSAISIDDIDDRIHNMEHMIQHETMPLKEEKQLIREIKQLKLLREQLSSQMGRQDERQQTSDQRNRSEERFKLLKQELDSLRKNLLQAEKITKVAKDKYFDENEKLRKLQSQFKAADDLRQEAYAHLQSLKKELYEKVLFLPLQCISISFSALGNKLLRIDKWY